MYLRSRRRIPITAWLIPILIILVVTSAIIFDYREQHRKFTVFGSSVDAHNVRQILVQPLPNDPGRKRPQVYKITAYNQIISVLKLLEQTSPMEQQASSANETVLDNMFVEFQHKSWELNLLQTPLSNQLYLQYNGKLFETPTKIVQAIKKKS